MTLPPPTPQARLRPADLANQRPCTCTLLSPRTMSSFDPVTIGIVSISDRASCGVYDDKGLPALQAWLTRAL